MTDTSNVTPEPDDQQLDAEPAESTTDWKAEARKWEARAKANAAKLKETAGAGAGAGVRPTESERQTELDAAIERATAAEARVAALESVQQLALWKTDIASSTGVPAQYLRGSTQDELQAHADELKPLFQTRGPIVPSAGQIPTKHPFTADQDAAATARRLFSS